MYIGIYSIFQNQYDQINMFYNWYVLKFRLILWGVYFTLVYTLVWDATYEQACEYFTEKCLGHHSKCANSDLSQFSAGSFSHKMSCYKSFHFQRLSAFL